MTRFCELAEEAVPVQDFLRSLGGKKLKFPDWLPPSFQFLSHYVIRCDKNLFLWYVFHSST
jgi:hypothetical protein